MYKAQIKKIVSKPLTIVELFFFFYRISFTIGELIIRICIAKIVLGWLDNPNHPNI